MSFRDVLRRDLRESVRTRVGVGMFVVVLGAVALPAAEILYRPVLEDRSVLAILLEFIELSVYRIRDGAVVAPGNALVIWLGTAIAWTVPLASLLLSYNAVLGERRRGTIKFLLGLPNSRLAVLSGKVAARSAILIAPVGLASVAFATVVTPETALQLVPLLGYSVLLTLCFVTIGVAISTLTTGGRRAIFLSISAYVVFRLAWRGFQFAYLGYTTGRVVPRGAYPDWFYLTSRLNPIHAAEAGVASLVDGADVFGNPFVAYAPPGSIYAADWLPAAVLGGWTVVVFGLTYARFRRTDITSV